MADLARVKGNVAKMAAQRAPEADIDGYLKTEGVTVEQVRDFRPSAAPTRRKDLLDELTRRAGQVVGIPYETPVPSPRQMAESGQPGLGEAAQMARDVLTIPTHFLNQFAFNYPRSAASQAGFDLPTEAEAPAARIAANAAGVAGGITSPLNKFMAGRFLRPGQRLLTRAAGSALTAGAYAPSEGLLEPRQRATQAAFGAMVPTTVAGLQKTGQIVTKTGRWIARNIGGVSDAAVGIIKRLGPGRVFDPAKAQVDYLGRVVAPKAQERIMQAVVESTDDGQKALKALGVRPEQISALRKVSPTTRQQLQGMFGARLDEIGERLGQIKAEAGKQFAKALPKKSLIQIKGPMSVLKNTLMKQGWIDLQGTELEGAGIGNKVKTGLVKILRHYAKAGPEGQVLAKGTAPLSARQYQNLLSELDALVGPNEQSNRLIYAVAGDLRKAAAKQIPALKQATKSWADAVSLQELKTVFTKLDNVVNLEQKLGGLKNVARPQLHEQWKTILGDDLYDDVLAHLANQDFELVSNLPGAGGGMYPSRAGMLRGMVSRGAKAYYQRGAPLKAQVQGAARRTLGTMRRVAGY